MLIDFCCGALSQKKMKWCLVLLFVATVHANSCYDFKDITFPTSTHYASTIDSYTDKFPVFINNTDEGSSVVYDNLSEIDGLIHYNTGEDYIRVQFSFLVEESAESISSFVIDITSFYTNPEAVNFLELWVYNFNKGNWSLLDDNVTTRNTSKNSTHELSPSNASHYLLDNRFYAILVRDAQTPGEFGIFVNYVRLCVETIPISELVEPESSPSTTFVWVILGVAGGVVLSGCIIFSLIPKYS